MLTGTFVRAGVAASGAAADRWRGLGLAVVLDQAHHLQHRLDLRLLRIFVAMIPMAVAAVIVMPAVILKRYADKGLVRDDKRFIHLKPIGSVQRAPLEAARISKLPAP